MFAGEVGPAVVLDQELVVAGGDGGVESDGGGEGARGLFSAEAEGPGSGVEGAGTVDELIALGESDGLAGRGE